MLLWHVRLVKFTDNGRIYHYHKGWIVRAETHRQACNMVEMTSPLDNGIGGEFEGWELTADISLTIATDVFEIL